MHAPRSAKGPVIALDTGQTSFKCHESVPARAGLAKRIQSQGSLAKARNKAEALACVGSHFKAKLKAVTTHVMYHSIQQSIQPSNACEESLLKVRERCVSRIAEKKYGTKSNLPSKVRWAATTRKSRKSGK
eukprot:4798963-Pleurochrysis_carterae.AAC.1